MLNRLTPPLNRFTQVLFSSKHLRSFPYWARSYSSFTHWRSFSQKLPDLAAANTAKEAALLTSHLLKNSITYDINKLGEEARVILKYCTYLDDEIPLELLREILPDEERLSKGLHELTEKTTLMQKGKGDTYSLHKDLLQELKAHVDHNKVVTALLKAIVDIFPNPQTFSPEDLKQAKRLLSCAKVVAEAANNMSGINTELELLRHMLGNYYMHTEQYAEAVRYYEQSLTMRQVIFLGDHLSVANAYTTLGRALQACGDKVSLSKGLWCFQDALALFTRLSPVNHSNIASALNNLGVAYINIGGEASLRIGLTHLTKALEVRRTLFQGDHLDIANSLNNLGIAYRDLKGEANVLKGLSYLEEAHRMFKTLCPDNRCLIANIFYNVATVYKDLGDQNKALEYYKQAYGLYLASVGPEHNDTMNLKSHIEKLQPDFFNKNGFVEKLQKQKPTADVQLGTESRNIILSHSRNRNENLMMVKQQIQGSVLNKIVDDCHIYGWHAIGWNNNHGVRAYLDPVFLREKLGDLGKDTSNVILAQMLCFEAMNLGVMKSDKKPYRVVASFARINCELVQQIALNYPEFFVDGSIVETCIRNLPEHAKQLKETVKYMGICPEVSGAEISMSSGL